MINVLRVLPADTHRAVLAIALCVSLSISGCTRADDRASVIRVGAPGGAGGVLAHYVANMINTERTIRYFNYELFSIEDCCAATSQFALLSLAVDAAIVCPTAAAELIAKDNRFEIIGPVLVNSVVIVARDAATVKKIGIAQQRAYQADIARKIFGETIDIVQVSPIALGVSYEAGAIDAAIVDIEDSLGLTGERIQVGGFLEYIETYVLVVRNDLPDLSQLLTSFTTAALELNIQENLQLAIDDYYRTRSTTGQEASQWREQSGIVFLPLVASCNCEPR